MIVMKNWLRKWKEKLSGEEGIGTVEIILILVVLIALVLIFKNQIMSLAEAIFSQINRSARDVYY